jgi:hypothetical protein
MVDGRWPSGQEVDQEVDQGVVDRRPPW